MKIRRITGGVAALAAAALVLSACSSDTGGDTSTDGATSPEETTSEEATDTDDGDDLGLSNTDQLTIGWNQPFNSMNANSISGNATANAIVLYLMQDGFNYYDAELNLVQDPSFGTYELVSDDPLTVKYTFADTAEWSDGEKVGPADLLLEWAAQSGKYNTAEAEYDEETGEVTNQEELDNAVYFEAASAGVALIEEVPTFDDNSITLVYTQPFVDWESNIGVNVPAHVVGKRALGIDDPAAARDAVVSAITENKTEDLQKISQVWTKDFRMTSFPAEADRDILTGSGAYEMTEYVENSHLTLKKRENYKGDHQGVFETITIRYSEDPNAQVTALQNGELDLISPQATADILTALQNLGDQVEIQTGPEGTYEHVDLQFTNGGPFDPATYGGNEETALKVRQAFLKTIPRQEIVDKLIVPLDPTAEVRNSYTTVPGAPMYDTIVEANQMEVLYPAATDIEGAKALLAEAGVEGPIEVRLLYALTNERRVQEAELIKASAEQAGFTVVDYVQQGPSWGEDLSGATNFYDAALFGWQSTSTAVSGSDANYRTGGNNNYYGYSNPQVDALFDELMVTTDAGRQEEILAESETLIAADGFGTTIFQFPGVTAWNPEKVGNIQKLTLSPTIFYGFWEWTKGAGS